jgi:F0F1-type ATP synthase membrane subunit c/vacuolar-type H+-ATPase subunit K
MEAEAAKLIGAGLAAIGMIGAGIGVGNVWASSDCCANRTIRLTSAFWSFQKLAL